MTRRSWWEYDYEQEISVITDPVVAWVREFRGSRRERYMMGDWDIESDPCEPDFSTALWTTYDAGWPTADYEVSEEDAEQTDLDRYALGLAQVDPSGEVGYFHWNQIGSTTAMTAANGTQVARLVYTAFGEPVYADASFATRYHYAGAWAYETFDEDLPFHHVGHRWYDPATGRFLQRDPIGIRGGLNVYEYAREQPVTLIDPTGATPQPASVYAELRIIYDFAPPGNYLKPPPTRRKRLTPEQELERIKKRTWFLGAECGILGGLALKAYLGAGMLDWLIHWDEGLNPVWGGVLENY